MTDEQWELVQKTPEWEAARLVHHRLVTKWRKGVFAKLQRKQEAMERRHARDRVKMRDAEIAAMAALAERADKLENESLAAVFEKYGLTAGRN